MVATKKMRTSIVEKHSEVSDYGQEFIVPDVMPQEVINEIKKWQTIQQSPYSFSYYSEKGKGWGTTPDGTIRVSDHWNFKTDDHRRVAWQKPCEDDVEEGFNGFNEKYENVYEYVEGGLHEKTNVPVEKGWWTVAKYSEKAGEYEVIKSVRPNTDIRKYAWQRLRARTLMFTDEQFEKIKEVAALHYELEVYNFSIYAYPESRRELRENFSDALQKFRDALKTVDFLKEGEWFKISDSSSDQIKIVDGKPILQEECENGRYTYYRNKFEGTFSKL
jgi:hypothetical protein